MLQLCAGHVPPPVLQLAVAASIAVVAAHVLVLTLYWGCLLLELRGEVRVGLRATAVPAEVDAVRTLHASLRRDRSMACLAAAVGVLGLAAAAMGAAQLPTTTGVRGDLPDLGESARFHSALSRSDGGLARPTRATLSLAQSSALRMSDPRQCRSLMGALAAVRASPHVLRLDTWTDAFVGLEGSDECDHLAVRASDGGLERLLLRHPLASDDLYLSSRPSTRDASGGGVLSPHASEPTEHAETLVLSTRFHLLLQLPPTTHQALEALADLQEAVDAAAASHAAATAHAAAATHAAAHAAALPVADGGEVSADGEGPSRVPSSHAPISLLLGGEAVATLELARGAPAACRAWVAGGAVGGAAVLLILLDPAGAFLSLLTNLTLGLLLLGTLALLPPPMGSGQLAWLALAVPMALHAPAVAIARIASSGERTTNPELAALEQLASPLLRSLSVSLLALAPLAILAPIPYLRRLALLLTAAIALGAAAALVALPLLHLSLRHPPPPPPPPPPRPPKKARPRPTSRLLSSAAGRLPSYGSCGTGAAAGSGQPRGSCLAEWTEGGTLPAAERV